MNWLDLSTDVAVVLGGTGVLGGALAEGLASAGASVVVAGRNEERGEARVAAIRAAGGRAVALSLHAAVESFCDFEALPVRIPGTRELQGINQQS
jgi:NAD(P)-dependent dehydrogenase (short-subunit alcohol dehydrogenase family)